MSSEEKFDFGCEIRDMSREGGEKGALESLDSPYDENIPVITRYGPALMEFVVSKLPSSLKEAVRSIGFGCMLDIACGKLPRSLIRALVDGFDPFNATLTMHGKTLKVKNSDMRNLLALPSGNTPVDYLPIFYTQEEFMESWPENMGIPLFDLIAHLVRSEEADDTFIRRFVLLALGVILCPTASICVESGYLNALLCVRSIGKKDWATWCMNKMIQGVSDWKSNKEHYVHGCVLFLQVI